MKRIDVVKKGDQWIAEAGGRMLTSAPTKVEAVRETARVARGAGEPVTVKIHGQNGRIQAERTYPRGADPRNRKG